jgi:hypothetical protein
MFTEPRIATIIVDGRDRSRDRLERRSSDSFPDFEDIDREMYHPTGFNTPSPNIGGGSSYNAPGIGGGSSYNAPGIGSGSTVHHVGGGIGGGVTVQFGSNSGVQHYYNVPLPYTLPLRGFSTDSKVRVVLMPLQNGNGFSIDMKVDDDFLLHFNPRFNENELVINSTRRGSWLKEERYRNPFQRGEVYTVDFVADSSTAIRIHVNGEYITSFEARGEQISRINSLVIGGNVKIHSVAAQ